MLKWLRFLNPWRHRRQERALEYLMKWLGGTYDRCDTHGRVELWRELILDVALHADRISRGKERAE